ncbi:MAG: BspA family leucine-rich repeat surface protein [Ruminococcus sp.]|uniref:BspA family leucine-rich repeat surface protein n=1 Tax=Ruminococcus sp. TaxID=41978 RepID=UPI0025FE02E2|nr:BspA family leucine-rich repeat surface protein [Ruminococcus sp.]MBO4865842.1 BspA family leucine-rich repeat surface protein [Ruminococcus sp.]
MQMKKILAVVMSLCMTAGVVSYGAPVITQTITAQAEAAAEAECYSFNQTTGLLTLKGEIDGGALRAFNTKYGDQVTSVKAESGTVFPEDSSKLLRGYYNCTSMDISNVDTSNVTNMDAMFNCCYNLTSLDVSSFDTSNVTDMSYMFSYCKKLKTLDVSNFDTSNVTDMYGMFRGCYDLTSLDVSNFDTSNVTNMPVMFGECYSLKSLNVSGFNTSNVTDMGAMFYDCKKLETLDLSGFDTSNVTNMDAMFNCCYDLTSLDISSFDTSKVTVMGDIFSDCTSLTTLDLSNFDISNVIDTYNMFSSCDNLKTLILGTYCEGILKKAHLPNGDGWVNAKEPKTIISGDGEYAVIENKGKNTYKRLPFKITYPTNINFEYSEKYRQVRFTWDKVEGADKYGIAVYLAGKWKVQAQNITDTVYTSPKNLTTGITYKVAIAARVNGKWDTANAINNAVTCTIGSYVKPDRETKYGAELYVIADEITMYLGPDTSYGKVTTIPGRTYLKELGDMKNNNNWAFIKYNGQYGWVQIVNESGEKQIRISYPYSIIAKPVIYLYPEEETNVHVEVELTEADLATTYPKYNNGWDVVAKPDGSLVNKADGTHHRYLFWDAVNCRTEFDFSKGFCVAGSDTESFLKEKLSYMGLTEEEMNEFIVYWLPKMEHNKYNLISFQSDKYTDTAKLNITPAPDSMLRVFMTYTSLEDAVDIEPQELSTFERKGFTVVEWGGSEVK